MNPLFDKDVFTEEDMNELIFNSVEESVYLDFKAGESLQKTDRKKKEIAKDISAFANSDGGVIVYGISEENHVAESLSPVDGNELTKEWLEHVINANIQKRIVDLRIYPVRLGGDAARTIYVVKIPRSNDAPHQSKDKRYYKRFNFESAMMEEYEVRDLFNRMNTAKMSIHGFSVKYLVDTSNRNNWLEFHCSIQNRGTVPVREFKSTVIFEGVKRELSVTWKKELDPIIKSSTLGPGRIKVYSTCSDTTYPAEVVDGIKFRVLMPKANWYPPQRGSKLSVHLFHDGGKDHRVFDYFELAQKAYANYQMSQK